jgi:hypothetical protein
MKFDIHSLELHRDIVLPPDAPAADGTIALFEYRSDVSERDLEPDPSRHLTDGHPVSVLPAGTYLFAQGLLDSTGPIGRSLPDAGTECLFREAAEAIWLEAIWRETELGKTRAFIRILSEDGKPVFQVFREIT